MMHLRSLRTALPVLALAFGGAAAPADGQPAPTPAGARVRARIVGPAGGPAGLHCEGQAVGVAGDTLRLAAGSGCPPGAFLADVEVAQGARGSRWAHAGLGLLGGALVGGVTARIAAGDGCRISPCDDGDFAVVILTVLGTAAGAAGGAVVGALLPAGVRWAPAGTARPLRVAGLAVRPGLRVVAGRGRR